jgi:hypothetical protein
MEDLNQPLDAHMGAEASDDKLQITAPIQNYWRETAGWALFLAILFFIFVGLAVFAMISGGLLLADQIGGKSSLGLTVLMLVYALVLFLPGWFYYKFATLTKQALANGSTLQMEEGFLNLKRYYRYIGILVIFVLALYVLLFFVVGIGAMSQF